MKKQLWLLVIISLLCATGFTSKLFSAGVREFNDGNYKKAIINFQNVVKNYPTEAIVHYNLGMAYFKAERYPESQSSFEAALQLEGKFEPLARFYIGLCYYQKGDNDRAKQELQWVSQICDNTNLGDAAKEMIKSM